MQQNQCDRPILSVRQEGEKLIGTAIMYDVLSHPITEQGRRFREIVKPGAFDLSNNITFVYRHNDDAVYGDTNSQTLRLIDSPTSLDFELDLPPYATRLREQINKGDINGMSIGFFPRDVERTADQQIVKKGLLVHIAAAKGPAYPKTAIRVREDELMKIRQRKLKIRTKY